jgi:hypothetical protein
MKRKRKLTKKRKQTKKQRRHYGGDPCASNDEPIIRNLDCNGKEDLISSEYITDGYCVKKNCIDKKTIQKLRANHLIHRPGNYRVADLRKKNGDFVNPYTNDVILNEAVQSSGIVTFPEAEEAYLAADDDYRRIVEEYEAAKQTQLSFNRLRPRTSQATALV